MKSRKEVLQRVFTFIRPKKFFSVQYQNLDYMRDAPASFEGMLSFVVFALALAGAIRHGASLYLQQTTWQIVLLLCSARWHHDVFCWLDLPKESYNT